MLSKLSFPAVVVLALSATAAQGQSLAQLGGPVNLPPSGFDGPQFVDDRGCLFMRAGFGGAVTWVPRVNRNHQPICGYPPSFAAATLNAVETAMAPEPTVKAPAKAADAPVATAPAPRTGMAQGGFWAALFGPVPRSTAQAQPAPASPPSASPLQVATIPTPPKGYKLAWTDDRLNPLRGIGTAEGQAQQDRLWTRQVPAQPVASPKAAAKPARATGQVIVSTMSAPPVNLATTAGADQADLRAFVQVGSFAVAANALAAQDRLHALGLPVATRQISHKGKSLTVVYAGPFASRDTAGAGLSAARQAGFADAVLRMN